MRNIKKLLSLILISYSVSATAADLISVFPLENYDQSVSTWIKPTSADYDKPLLDNETQQKRFELFWAHTFGTLSPWTPDFVNLILKQAAPNDFKTVEMGLINLYNNKNKSDSSIGYGENFRPHTQKWIDDIATNIHLEQFDNLTYQAHNRAIAITNLHGRVLPTNDVHFYSHKLAGQGYPFDNLQMTAIWAGTPLYVMGTSADRAWTLVITPDVIAWVKTDGIAKANASFINTWQTTAKSKLAAITRTETSLNDESTNQFLLSAYVGSVFPAIETSAGLKLLVPVKDQHGNAVIKQAITQDAATMPLRATPHQFANIIETLKNRPYGWGSMYFYNDCSAELKSLYTPFGIWLQRHSSAQVLAGKMVDMTSATTEQRLNYLMQNGQRFLTIVYIGGHIVLYLGNYENPLDSKQSLMAMTYQNIWGLLPATADRRAVIGQSVLFPMLLQYPEDQSLVSLAGKKYFQVANLTEFPTTMMLKASSIDLKALMYPEKME